MVAAADAHDYTAVRDNVRHGIVFGEPDRMPHRQHVKGATEFQPVGLSGEPQAELDEIGEDFIALTLEMVLGSPQHVEAELIHQLRDLPRGMESFPQSLIRIAPLVRRYPFQADIFKLDLTDIQNVK